MIDEQEQELLDILQVFWSKYAVMYNYIVEEGESPHRDIIVIVTDLQNIQNRILARTVRRNMPERFTS
jgi:hypothetical protein